MKAVLKRLLGAMLFRRTALRQPLGRYKVEGAAKTGCALFGGLAFGKFSELAGVLVRLSGPVYSNPTNGKREKLSQAHILYINF